MKTAQLPLLFLILACCPASAMDAEDLKDFRRPPPPPPCNLNLDIWARTRYVMMVNNVTTAGWPVLDCMKIHDHCLYHQRGRQFCDGNACSCAERALLVANASTEAMEAWEKLDCLGQLSSEVKPCSEPPDNCDRMCLKRIAFLVCPSTLFVSFFIFWCFKDFCCRRREHFLYPTAVAQGATQPPTSQRNQDVHDQSWAQYKYLQESPEPLDAWKHDIDRTLLQPPAHTGK
ncbi:unnamed protein product, partial [Mesorhabditis spiculigera]